MSAITVPAITYGQVLGAQEGSTSFSTLKVDFQRSSVPPGAPQVSPVTTITLVSLSGLPQPTLVLTATNTAGGRETFVAPVVIPRTSSTTSTSSSVPSSLQPSATSQNSTTNPSAGQHCDGLAGGKVAGIAIGTLIAGALLASAIFYFFVMGHRKKRHSHDGKARKEQRQFGFRPTSAHAWQGEDPAVANLDYILPQSLDDSSIKAAVSDFFKRIEDHVDSRFYPDHVRVDEKVVIGMESSLAAHATQPHLDIGVLLSSQRSRFHAFKSLICAELLQAVDFEGDQSKTLLPRIVPSFLSKVTEGLRDDHPTRLCLSRWRTSTTYLLGDQHNPEEKAARDAAATKIVHTLNPALAPFADQRYEDDRQEDLFRVCKKAEQLGMTLLAQPAEWMFDWALVEAADDHAEREPRGRGRGGRGLPNGSRAFVVFPALVKVTDKSARIIQPRQTVLRETRSQAE